VEGHGNRSCSFSKTPDTKVNHDHSVISPCVRLLSAFGSVCFYVSHRHSRTFEDLESKTRKREDIFPHVHLLATVYRERKRVHLCFSRKRLVDCSCLKVRAVVFCCDTVPSASQRLLQGSCSSAVSIDIQAHFSTATLRLPSRAVVPSVLTAWCVPENFRMRVKKTRRPNIFRSSTYSLPNHHLNSV
jgi:hypothetical protein